MTKEAAKKETKVLNPFDVGVTYDSFLKSLGKKSIKDALKGKCSEDQINWIETEVKQYKTK